MPSPEVFLPGPFVTIPSSSPAVGSALAAYPRWLIAEFEQEVLYERGLAQVGFGVLPLLSLYFLLSKRLTVCLTWFDLVRATAAHRTPQGGSLSALLSNVYLHYVLDLWFERRFTELSGGSVSVSLRGRFPGVLSAPR